MTLISREHIRIAGGIKLAEMVVELAGPEIGPRARLRFQFQRHRIGEFAPHFLDAVDVRNKGVL